MRRCSPVLAAKPTSVWVGKKLDELCAGLHRRRAWFVAAPSHKRREHALARNGLSLSHPDYQHHWLARDGPDRGLSRVQGRGFAALAAVLDDRNSRRLHHLLRILARCGAAV